MGSKAKEEAIISLIRTETPDILLIQETKLEDITFLQASKKLWIKSEARAIFAWGASGGIGTLWNISKFAVLFEARNTHWLLLKMQNLDTKETFCLFNVYSPVNVGGKKYCWDSIRNQVDLKNLENIIIAGDLNLTLHSSEKRGGNAVRDPAREWVEDIMQDWDLLDIKPSSGNISDHKPIKLELLAHIDLGLITFRFSPLWVKEQDFMQTLKECWNQPVKGSPFYIWEEKLRRVKGVLKRWAKTLSNPDTERKYIKASLVAHQICMVNAILTKELLDQEAQLQQCYHKACLAEEEYWRLKSHNLWLKAGDRNTTFFHKQAQARKCFNTISDIKEDNDTHKDFDYIKKAAFSHFQNLYSEDKNPNQYSDLLDIITSVILNE
eukprot:PITA_19942